MVHKSIKDYTLHLVAQLQMDNSENSLIYWYSLVLNVNRLLCTWLFCKEITKCLKAEKYDI